MMPQHEEIIIVTSSRLLPSCIAAVVAGAIVIALCVLVYRIIFPTVLSHPWDMPPEGSRERKQERDMTVVFAGSFNPPHWGHLVMIKYLAERYGRVICCIGVNPNKQYDVTPQTRAHILRKMLDGISDGGAVCKNVEVQVVEGYIWRYARTQNVCLFFRGIRTWSADGPEERNLQILNTWGPLLLGPLVWPLKTIFLEGDPRYRDVSSTMVRRICADIKQEGKHGENDEELLRFIPGSVSETIVEAYGKE